MRLRLAAGLSQEALALESGLSRNQIVLMEWGRRGVTYERLFDIAEALSVPVCSLFERPAEAPFREPYRGGRQRMSRQSRDAEPGKIDPSGA
jgi:transcriptional regulator with XRE-family HTH domain